MVGVSENPCHEYSVRDCGVCAEELSHGVRQCSAICVGCERNRRCKRSVTHTTGICWQHRGRVGDLVDLGSGLLDMVLNPEEIAEDLLLRVRTNGIQVVVFGHDVTISSGGSHGADAGRPQLTRAFVTSVRKLIENGYSVFVQGRPRGESETPEREVRDKSSSFMYEVLVIGIGALYASQIRVLTGRGHHPDLQEILSVTGYDQMDKILLIDHNNDSLVAASRRGTHVLHVSSTGGFGSHASVPSAGSEFPPTHNPPLPSAVTDRAVATVVTDTDTAVTLSVPDVDVGELGRYLPLGLLPRHIENIITGYTEDLGCLATCGCAPLRTYDIESRQLIVNANVPIAELCANITKYTDNREILDGMTFMQQHPTRVQIYKIQTPPRYLKRRGKKKRFGVPVPVIAPPSRCYLHTSESGHDYIVHLDGAPVLHFISKVGNYHTDRSVQRLGIFAK
jgi:hypothetical protein